jgi:hypothetical protein
MHDRTANTPIAVSSKSNKAPLRLMLLLPAILPAVLPLLTLAACVLSASEVFGFAVLYHHPASCIQTSSESTCCMHDFSLTCRLPSFSQGILFFLLSFLSSSPHLCCRIFLYHRCSSLVIFSPINALTIVHKRSRCQDAVQARHERCAN